MGAQQPQAPAMKPALVLPAPRTISPLSLADRLLSLAKEADLAGLPVAADRLVGLAFAVLDQGLGANRLH